MSVIEQLARRIAELERRVRELEARENLAFNASNITSGTLHTDRYSAYADLQAEGKIGLVTGRLPTADDVRGLSWFYPVVQDWTSTTLPDGWQWAGSPFVTPPQTEMVSKTVLTARSYTDVSRSFLYRASVDQTQIAGRLFFHSNSSTFVGIRLDDDSDDNFVELVIRQDVSERIPYMQMRFRQGGEPINEYNPTNMKAQFLLLTNNFISMEIQGTRWSSWSPKPRIFMQNGIIFEAGVSLPADLTWTPTRFGIVIQSGANTWERFGVDWTNF